MKAHKTKIGFEFEFCAKTTAGDIIEDLNRRFDCKFTGKVADRWRLTFDSSIKASNFYFAHELVSPQLDYKVGLTKLSDILTWMADRQYRTNHTTGLHINLSFIEQDRNLKVDPVKLIVFTPCNEFLAQYKRTRNMYCKSYDNDFKRWSKYLEKDRAVSWKKVVTTFRSRLKMSADSKYRAISFHNDPKNPYFEFRMIGNTGYHNRYPEIKLNIEEMVEAMHIGSNRRSCTVEYEQAMSKYVL